MLERDSHKAKTSCIAWKRNKSGVEVTRLTQELSTGTKRKKGMLECCFSSFPDKKSHKIYEVVSSGMDGMGITTEALYNLKIY